MRKMFLCVIVISLFKGFEESYAQNVFNEVYNSTNNWYDGGDEVVITNDGGYLIIGDSFYSNLSLIFIIKCNQTGDTLWTKHYDISPGGSVGAFGISKIGSNFMITGRLYDTLRKEDDVYLLKIDSLGNILWFKTLDLGYSDKGTEIKIAPKDDGFLITGYIYDDTTYNSSTAFLVKTDTGGNILWQQNYGDTGYDFTYSISFTSDGGYLLGGETSPYASSLNDLMLIKTDSIGNLIWRKTYGGSMRDGGGYALVDKNDDYILVGHKQLSADDYQGYVIKTDSDGKIIWEKKFGTGYATDLFRIVRQLNDGNYIAGGSTRDYTYAPQRYAPRSWIVKINLQGDSIWGRIYSKFWEKNEDDYMTDLKISNDGGFLICGYIPNAMPGTRNDVWLVKTDCYGFVENAYPVVADFSYSAEQRTATFANQSDSACWYKWSFGDGDSSIEKNPAHTYADTGMYVVTLISYNADKADTIQKSVKIQVTGIKDFKPDNSIILYPNPIDDKVTLSLNFAGGTVYEFQLFNTIGQLCLITTVKNNPVVDLSSVSESGMYFFRIMKENNMFQKGKIIIKK